MSQCWLTLKEVEMYVLKPVSLSLSLFLILICGDFFSLFLRDQFLRERGRERGRERQKQWCERKALIACLPYAPQLGNHMRSQPTMCPDWELNLQPFSYRTTLQPTEPHWPGLSLYFKAMLSLPLFCLKWKMHFPFGKNDQNNPRFFFLKLHILLQILVAVAKGTIIDQSY